MRRLYLLLPILVLALFVGCSREEASDPAPGLESASTPLVPFKGWNGDIHCEPGTPPARRSGDEVVLPVKFSGTNAPNRASWDFRFKCDLRDAVGVQFDFFCDDLEQFSSFSCYLHSGGGWYHASFAPLYNGKWFRASVHKERCAQEGRCSGWGQIDTIRISGWRAGTNDTRCLVRNISPIGMAKKNCRVVVVTCESAAKTMAQSRDFAKFAENVTITFAALGVSARHVADTDLSTSSLSGASLVVLPYNPSLPDAASAALREFVSFGGKLLVCYSMPKVAFDALGLEYVRHVRAEELGLSNFGGFVRVGKGLEGQPEFSPQASWISAVVKGGEVLAKWGTKRGPHSAEIPALVRGKNGMFISHVWLGGGGRAQCELMRSIVAALVPGSDDEIAAHISKHEKLIGDIGEWLKRRKNREGEFRAFWCHSAWGLGGEHDWDSSIKFLKDNGFNAIFANLCWGGSAFYRSDVLETVPAVNKRGDAFDMCREACRRHSVEFHVWRVCWNMGNAASTAYRQKMVQEGRVQRTFAGEVKDSWFCPSHPLNRRQEIAAMLELAKKGVDGIHFDYIRYPDGNACFCEGCRERFERRIGRNVADWPASVRDDAALKKEWNAFRKDNITAVVKAVSECVRMAAPGVKISAAVFSGVATCGDAVAQNWGEWCRRGYLDFACPMNYVESPAMLKSAIRGQLRAVDGKVPIYSGLGLAKLADDGTDARDLAMQIEAVREMGLKGFTVFNFDRRAETVLPLLHLSLVR